MIRIRDDPNISGIKIDTEDFKLCAFADDPTCILKDKLSYINLQRIRNSFSACQEVKLKFVGRNRNNPDRLIDLKLSDKPVKILGIYFTYNKKEIKGYNFDKVLKKCINNCIARVVT